MTAVPMDVALFAALNDEWRPHPLVPEPPSYTPEALATRGKRTAEHLLERFSLSKKRVLEIGCGLGEIAVELARLGCEVVGVDVNPALPPRWKDKWSDVHGFRGMIADLTRPDGIPAELGRFDFILSNGVMEHVRDPSAMMAVLPGLLAEGGQAHLNMGFHRSAIGSHLYRDVFFPWPHLLFSPDVFAAYFVSKELPIKRPVWINHYTPEQYLDLARRVGLEVGYERRLRRPIDEPFYQRFAEILDVYSRADLETDMLYVDLRRPRLWGGVDFQVEGARSDRHFELGPRVIFLSPNSPEAKPIAARSRFMVRAVELRTVIRNQHPAGPPIRFEISAHAPDGTSAVLFDKVLAPGERIAWQTTARFAAPVRLSLSARIPAGFSTEGAWAYFDELEVREPGA